MMYAIYGYIHVCKNNKGKDIKLKVGNVSRVGEGKKRGKVLLFFQLKAYIKT